MATSGYKNISRIDAKKARGWYVRVRFQKQLYTKFFSDGVYGGKEAALDEAVRWRNETEKAIGKPRTNRMVLGKFPGNNTGVLGVTRVQKWTGARDKDGNPLPNYTDNYQVTWCPQPGVVKRKSFSIPKYGEEEAFRLACKHRKRMEREIYGGEIPSEPIPPHKQVSKLVPAQRRKQGEKDK